jgi:hypothetical protein
MPETPEIPEELPLAEVAAVAVIAEATLSAQGGKAVASQEIRGGTPTSQKRDAHPNEQARRGPRDVGHPTAVAEATKENAPMLDIHDAHHAASTWRDFFIHIATIVLGLMIAVSLEQTVEYFHHRTERKQLEEDLRSEAERRIPLITANLKQFAIQTDWCREGLQRGRAATASGGFVTFILPDRQQTQTSLRSEDAAWPAAKASGLVAVLSNQEVEVWDRVDHFAQSDERGSEDRIKAGEDFRAVADRLGVSVAPGATVRVTPEERDELMRALALYYESMRHFMSAIAAWQGASDAAVHGASGVDQMQPYIDRAQAALPK